MTYDKALPSSVVEELLTNYAVSRVSFLVGKAGEEMVGRMGGIEKLLRRSFKDAQEAREDLKLPPDQRLLSRILFWKDVLLRLEKDPLPLEPEEDPEYGITVDRYLMTRILEVEEALLSGDVEGAFTIFRNFEVMRPGEEHEFPLPDSLDCNSAYWVDLRLTN